MGIESGPSFGGFGFESEPAVNAIARAELMADISGSVEHAAHRYAETAISEDPILHAMLSKVINSGPELDPAVTTHLKRMIAMRLHGATEVAIQAAKDQEFYREVVWRIQDELLDLKDFEKDLSDVPDLWDLAYEDLSRLEGDQN